MVQVSVHQSDLLGVLCLFVPNCLAFDFSILLLVVNIVLLFTDVVPELISLGLQLQLFLFQGLESDDHGVDALLSTFAQR